MPDEKKSTGEPASSDEKSAPEESKPAAESKPAGEGEKPPAGEAPETPKPAAAEGSKPDAPAEKPAATESSQPDATAAQPPSGEKPAPAEKGAEAAKPASSDKPADAEKPAAKPAAPAAKVDPKAGDEKPAAKPAAKPPPKKAPTEMETTPWEGPLVDRLKERFGDEITAFSSYKGDDFLVAKLPAVFTIIQYLKAEEGFDYLVDVTALHYPKKEKPFEVFWILYSHPHNVRIRVKTEVAEDESPRSVDSLYKTANWLEREVYDMFGITFAEHPNMTRILLPDEWQGYPLRKDYSIIEQDQEWIRENLNIESGQ